MQYAQSSPVAEAFDDADEMSEPRFDTRAAGRSAARSSRFKDDWGAGNRPSLGKRMFRALTRFIITVLIGVGGTLAWQSQAAREMLVAEAPTLASLLSVSTTDSSAMAATPTASTLMAATPMAATPAEPAQALEPLASNLDAVRRSVEQLADKQDQMAQSIATLQAVEEDIRQRMAVTPSPPQQAAAPVPLRRPQQARVAPRQPPPAAGPVELSR
jgi:hypothetical protein